jgi:hypothetical protein
MTNLLTTNRGDFYRSEQIEPAVSASSVCVFVDGKPAAGLAVKKIVRAGYPEFGFAKLALIKTQDLGIKTEDGGKAIGKRIKIVRYLKRKDKPEAVGSYCIFSGQIESVDRQIDKNGEILEFFARDYSCVLERITVYGRRAADSDGSVIFLPGLDTVFNEDSKGNASAEKLMRDGKLSRLFAADSRQSAAWSYAEVIEYLLNLYLPAGLLQSPNAERLSILTDNQRVYDLDLTGLSLAEALQRCCKKTGLGYKFVPVQTETGPEQAICFFRLGRGRGVEINLQDAGGKLNLSRTDVFSLVSRKENFSANKYIVQGDFKTFEATFELVKAWDGLLEGTNYYTFSPSSNPDFYKVKDVYRKWVLNEAGDYSGPPYNQGEAFDFSHIFGSGNFVRKRRRFWPSITGDKNGKSLGYFLEVSYDDGAHWWQYSGSFENRTDECAVWLSGNKLDVDTWVAALKGVLRVRITASVISDERISRSISDGACQRGIATVREHITAMPSRFKYRKVTPESIFAGRGDVSFDEADDGAALYEYVRGVAKASAADFAGAGNFKVQTMCLMPDYDVGDLTMNSPESKNIFGQDNQVVSVIERAEMDFDNQSTQLKIAGYRKVYV